MRPQQTEYSNKGTSHPSPHNILIMGAAFSRSLWPRLFTFHRFHCRYLFAWNRPVNRLPGLRFVPSSPLGNSVPVWYRSLLAAFVSPTCTNHGFLPGMSHLLSVCWTEQALCTCWYNTTDQSFYTRIPDPPRGLIKLSMSYRNVSSLNHKKEKQPAVGDPESSTEHAGCSCSQPFTGCDIYFTLINLPTTKVLCGLRTYQISFTFINTIKFSNCFQKNDGYDLTN